MNERIDNLKKDFQRLYGSAPAVLVKGPGRVDLMGIHTDYNDGFVLPIAVNVDVLAVGKARDDRKVSVHSINFDKTAEFSLDNIEFDNVNRWSNYIRGVCHFIQEKGIMLQGANIVLHGNVPLGSGLSSSAALEMATGVLFQALTGFEMSGPDMALVGQRAENKFVGVNTGIMDQFVSRNGQKDHALFLDCRSLAFEQLPLDTSKVKVVVCNTMKQRGLVDSEYGLRRSQCEEAVRLFQQWKPGVKALRDVTCGDLAKYGDKLPEVVRMRAEHVISENERGLKCREVLASGGLEEFGELMNASHDSARDCYEVSCPELEAMVEVTRSAPGSLCGRLAGAGFGGCTVSLVGDASVEDFVETVKREYEKKTGLAPALYVCTAEDGAGVLETN
ncbi:MAG: galactokinase [Armatimonadetes bacterium]|nr:galactokinase [Armatimonadota bacterium]